MANNDNYEYMRFLDLAGAQQIWNTAKQTFVQTVNGQGIDANGNVNVSSGLTTEEGDFVKSEYNKTLNLFNIDDLNIGTYLTVSGNSFTLNSGYGYPNNVMKNNIQWKANTQYSFSGIKSNTTGNVRIDIKYTDNSTDTLTWNDNVYTTFTSQSGKTIEALICNYGGSGATTYTNFMIVEGTTPMAYQAYGGGAIAHIGNINKIVYQAVKSTTFNTSENKTLLSTTLEQGHTYLIIGHVDLDISSSEIMNASLIVSNGNTITLQRNARTIASNGGGTIIGCVVDATNYAPTVKLESYNYTGVNNAPVRCSLDIARLK